MLENSERFQKEFLDFQARASKITDEKVRQELTNLMNKLIYEVRLIDQQHVEILNSKMVPEHAPDTRQKILEIRKSIDKKLNDWEYLQSNQA